MGETCSMLDIALFICSEDGRRNNVITDSKNTLLGKKEILRLFDMATNYLWLLQETMENHDYYVEVYIMIF